MSDESRNAVVLEAVFEHLTPEAMRFCADCKDVPGSCESEDALAISRDIRAWYARVPADKADPRYASGVKRLALAINYVVAQGYVYRAYGELPMLVPLAKDHTVSFHHVRHHKEAEVVLCWYVLSKLSKDELNAKLEKAGFVQAFAYQGELVPADPSTYWDEEILCPTCPHTTETEGL